MLRDWRDECHNNYLDSSYTAMSHCSFVDDGNYQWQLVVLLISLLHTREAMRRQGQWRTTSRFVVPFYGAVLLLTARMLQVENVVAFSITASLMAIAFTYGVCRSITPDSSSLSFGKAQQPRPELHQSEGTRTQCQYCKGYFSKMTDDQRLETPVADSSARLDSAPAFRVDDPRFGDTIDRSHFLHGKFCVTCGQKVTLTTVSSDRGA